MSVSMPDARTYANRAQSLFIARCSISFEGLVKLLKLPRINSLVCQLPDTMDWVFKLKRKKLTIEVRVRMLHILCIYNTL